MAELLNPFGEEPPKSNNSRYRAGLAMVAALICGGAGLVYFSNKPGEQKQHVADTPQKQEKLAVRGLPHQKAGRGDLTFKLKLDPVTYGYIGPESGSKEFILGVGMDCEPDKGKVASISVEDLLEDYETYVCGSPQKDILKIPEGDRLLRQDEVMISVDTNDEQMEWVVGVGIRIGEKYK